jgi:hypothetical protein
MRIAVAPLTVVKTSVEGVAAAQAMQTTPVRPDIEDSADNKPSGKKGRLQAPFSMLPGAITAAENPPPWLPNP